MDTTQLLKGVLDLAVLAVLRDEDGYGYDILRRLRAAGLEEVGDASVYGTLRRLFNGRLPDHVRGAQRRGPAPQVLRAQRRRPGPVAAVGQDLAGVRIHDGRSSSRAGDGVNGTDDRRDHRVRRARSGPRSPTCPTTAPRRAARGPARAPRRGRRRRRRPLAERLGPPDGLRRRAARRAGCAGGFPDPPPAPDRWPRLRGRAAPGASADRRGRTRRSGTSGRASSSGLLRPAWWVLRGYLAAMVLAWMLDDGGQPIGLLPRIGGSDVVGARCCSPRRVLGLDLARPARRAPGRPGRGTPL